MLLDSIYEPSDLRKLTTEQLVTLAAEIRTFLIENLAITGGHLASNLGIVELTLALHYRYNSPQDRIIFDVGHQAYVHKMITGRKPFFHTLRQYKGLSGFLKRMESEHDVWEAGHSSTSLSAAMGMAVARDLQQASNRVIAVIGDGALTGGMALEALNHIGHEQRKLMVILNDNEMSIAPNVGALHHYLSKIRSDRNYMKVKEEVEQLVKKIPAIGGKLAKTMERVKDGLKYIVVSGMLFEEFGLKYFGPVDGHQLDKLCDIFAQADRIEGPVFIHIVTRKGKGYFPAEEDAHKWHGTTPYKVESGKPLQVEKKMTYTDVFGKTIIELAQSDKRIVVVTPAMPGGSGLLPFAKLFPDRMIDVGIAEQHAATMCAAMAMAGLKPIFAVYSTFLQRAYDQVVHDICRQQANVIFAIDRAGFVGPDGETHQGVFDVAFLRHIPHMIVMMPKDENELRRMLKTAVSYNDGPIAIRYPRISVSGVAFDTPSIPIALGTWEVMNEGDDIVIAALGPMVQIATTAAAQLRKVGIHLRVLNARFMKPLDEQMLLQISAEQLPMLVLEENSIQGGLGSAILEWYAQQSIYGMKIKLLAVPDCFIEHGTISEQRQEAGLTVETVIMEVYTLLHKIDDRQSLPRI